MMLTSLFCIAATVFYEARDQPLDAQLAVASTVINRVNSSRWPQTPCEVVYQKAQYSFTHDGLSDNYRLHRLPADRQAADIAEDIAKMVLSGETLGGTSTHYYAAHIAPPFWSKPSVGYHRDGRYGDHIFFTAIPGK